MGICGWCTREMPEKATNCPSCGKLRKDIYKEKILNYTFAVFLVVFGYLFAVGINNETWHTLKNVPETFHSYRGWGSAAVPVETFNINIPRHCFSLTKFLSSASGIFVLVGNLVCLFGTFYFHIKVAKKLGSWLWV